MAKLSAGENKISNSMGPYLILLFVSFVLGGLVVYFAFGNSSTVRCDQFKDSSLEASCYTNLAIDRKDVSICSNVAGLGSINGCYKEVAIAKLDETICARIDDNLMKDSCYNRVGSLTKDKSVCNMIKDQNLKNGCFVEIGIVNQTLPAGSQTDKVNVSKDTGTGVKTEVNPAVVTDQSQRIIIFSFYLRT